MTEYQEMAVKVYHNESSTIAAREIALELLLNSGWAMEDVEACKDVEPRKRVMIFLA